MTEPVRISPADAHAKMAEGYTYVDVRTPEEFAEGRPAGAVNVPLGDDFVALMDARFAKDTKIVVGCKAGGRSLRAAKALLAAGYTDVLDQRAGFDAARGPFGEITEPGWSRSSLPVEK
ncbi:MAG: rhodanese-like domain-containing protein [Labilithrix sp.]|nr:rhodanese-like domain-containing protein [Labilithrix sp.]MCW5817750.1 rhodanese-like domain-containing protein [Labilithrix sp.]